MGSGRGNGRFWGVGVIVGAGGPRPAIGHAVSFAEPASQVDQAAARTAERPLGPLLGARALHPAITNGTACINHRQTQASDFALFAAVLASVPPFVPFAEAAPLLCALESVFVVDLADSSAFAPAL